MGTQGRTEAPEATAAIRGSAVPFTAPSLFGARARQLGRGLELLLPNPSGGRGVYVMGWAMVADAAMPSVHDAVLGKALAALAVLNPATVRSAAREVAAAGYAGRAARNAAVAAQERLAKAVTELWRGLAAGMARDSALPPDQTRRLIGGLAGAEPAAPGLDALAARLNWQAGVLARLARHYVVVTDQGRATLLLRRAVELRGTLGGADRVPAELELFLGRARDAVDAARVAIASPGRLLATWRGDPARALAPAERVETLFDGWERVLALCSDRGGTTGDGGGGEVPADALALMRLAAADLAGVVQIAAGGDQIGAMAGRHDPSAPSRTCRNERVRALELSLEHGYG